MDEKEKIQAIFNRSKRCANAFCYGVKTTRIVCRPSCSARLPSVKNIELFDTLEDAVKKGYRLCKICMRNKNKIIVKPYQSPCGILLLGSTGDKLCLCDWRTEKHSDKVDRRLKRMLDAEFEEGTSDVIAYAERQLDEYFAGKRRTFDVPLFFIGTDFQKTGMGRTAENPLRHNRFLRRDGPAYRPAHGCPCGGQRQRGKSHVHLRPLPPGNRQRPFADWLRRRTRLQTKAA